MITEDNVVVEIDTVLYFTITDPRSASYEIANPLQAIEQLTVTTLRNVIGGLTLEETLTSRENVNTQLRVVLDEATASGASASTASRSSPSTRRPHPGGDGEADARRARPPRRDPDRRGGKQAQILTAEGEKQAAVLKAEGARQAAILRSEGEAKAIATVFEAIHEGRPRPEAAQLPVPADAAPARPGRGQQGVRHPVGVHPGLRRHRRSPGLARSPGAARAAPASGPAPGDGPGAA